MAEFFVHFLINFQDKQTGDSALHYGAKNVDDFQGFENRVISGVNVHLRNKKGRTALHETAKYSTLGVNAIKLLIAHDADVNSLDNEGSSILHDALKNPEVEVQTIEYLLGKKAYPNFRDIHDLPPLGYVESSNLSSNDKKTVSELLIKYGVLRNFKDFDFHKSTSAWEADKVYCLHFCKNESKRLEYAKFRALCIQEILAMAKENLRLRLSMFKIVYNHCFESTVKSDDKYLKKAISLKNKYPIYGEVLKESAEDSDSE